MATQTCPLCSGSLAPCNVVTVLECHGRERSRLGAAKHRSSISSQVCTDCGHLQFFADHPRQFRAEIEPTAVATDRLPIPMRNVEQS
jgi:hypothetical protein